MKYPLFFLSKQFVQEPSPTKSQKLLHITYKYMRNVKKKLYIHI
jgi:hypothetical protein